MNMTPVLVIGAGMVGRAMALDLATSFHVTCADFSGQQLASLAKENPAIQTVVLDVRNAEDLQNTIKPFSLVVCAVPGYLGFATLKQLIEAGKNVVDISFFPENGLELDSLAREKGVTILIDCGVAPGMDNLILGYHNTTLDVRSFECLVGGLPLHRKWPFEYKAPFSPIDVIEEYTRPARYVENGVIVTRPALSDAELVEFEGVGTLEAFNTDGLRSLLFTMPHIPDMKEKTLRYPGHIGWIKALQAVGFFSQEPISIQGALIRPLDFTSQLLFTEWKLGTHEAERTVMRVTVEGTDRQTGIETVICYDLYDEYDPKTNTSSMARTTGYTATAIANMFREGIFSEKGVFPPEHIGQKEECFHYILNYLSDRGVLYHKSQKNNGK